MRGTTGVTPRVRSWGLGEGREALAEGGRSGGAEEKTEIFVNIDLSRSGLQSPGPIYRSDLRGSPAAEIGYISDVDMI